MVAMETSGIQIEINGYALQGISGLSYWDGYIRGGDTFGGKV